MRECADSLAGPPWTSAVVQFREQLWHIRPANLNLGQGNTTQRSVGREMPDSLHCSLLLGHCLTARVLLLQLSSLHVFCLLQFTLCAGLHNHAGREESRRLHSTRVPHCRSSAKQLACGAECAATLLCLLGTVFKTLILCQAKKCFALRRRFLQSTGGPPQVYRSKFPARTQRERVDYTALIFSELCDQYSPTPVAERCAQCAMHLEAKAWRWTERLKLGVVER